MTKDTEDKKTTIFCKLWYGKEQEDRSREYQVTVAIAKEDNVVYTSPVTKNKNDALVMFEQGTKAKFNHKANSMSINERKEDISATTYM